MFDEITNEIFVKAGVDKTKYPELWDEAKQILANCMASLSVTHGLSMERVQIFEKQKQTLVDDLVRMKLE
jgi:hypothetical protein